MPKQQKPTAYPNTWQEDTGAGLPDRRLFMKQGAALGLSAFVAPTASAAGDIDRPAWMLTPGMPFSNYGQPSPYEQGVIRWIANNPGAPGNGISWTPLQKLAGTITPSGLHFERHHNGVPRIDPAHHRLLIHGLVKTPLFFTLDKLYRYPMTSRTCFIECGGNSNALWHQEPMQAPLGNLHGLTSCSEWTGVPLSILLEEAGVDPKALWLIADGADAAAMNISIPLAKAMDDAMVAIYQNGEHMRPENGYPMRLLLPGWEGVTQVKWLRSLEVADRPVMARNETAKYTELQADGKARQFTFVMEAKSLITHPSPGLKLREPGLYPISGLAWSGRGKITRVEVSADNGKTWADAQLQDPILSCSFTRFRMPWRWDGAPALLKSRATDETGYVQPEREQLLAARGSNAYFHFNGIVCWAVSGTGEISHAYA